MFIIILFFMSQQNKKKNNCFKHKSTLLVVACFILQKPKIKMFYVTTLQFYVFLSDTPSHHNSLKV